MQSTMQNQNNTFKNEMRNEMQVTMSNQTNELKNMMASFFQMNIASSSGTGSLPSNTVANPRGDLKAITTRSGISYDGPPIPPPLSPLPKVVERERPVTKGFGANQGMVECSALADLGASINLMPLSFHYPANFLVVDYDADPRVPLIIGRPFLRTTRALIDVYGEEITLRFNDEARNFKVVCSRSARIFDSSISGNPTPSDPIIASSSPSFTPFEGGDFILEEIETFLRTPEELSNLVNDYYDTEGDILYLEKLLNEDPSPTLPTMKNDDLKQVDVTMTKPSTEEPLELELKDLPSHLEYGFLEGTDKLPVIISKELKDEEKRPLTLIRLLITQTGHRMENFDIKGIDPSFCTHKILMEDDFKPAVQHQRRVSPVHCVPKKGGMTVVVNEDNELFPTRLVTGWRVCIDYRKLNDATRKDHFPLPFMDQMLERLAGNEYYCFLDGFSRDFQIPIDPKDQDKTTFTCPYGTFAY
ncbi:hypothetical protein Tco_0866790 [Tanacetum coccineum]